MKLAALFSGGKDSTFSIHLAKQMGHEIKCLVSVFPNSADSHLLHHPNMAWTELQSKSMRIPHLTVKSNDTTELEYMKKILTTAKEEFSIEGIVHGGIKSKFQKDTFENLCADLELATLSPLWNSEPEQYMRDLLSSKFDFIMSSVSSDGLNDSWLGKEIRQNDLEELISLAKKFHFNLNFEGGEAETFVINCPLFSHPIEIIEGKKFWDGYRGRFEILEARLNYDAR